MDAMNKRNNFEIWVGGERNVHGKNTYLQHAVDYNQRHFHFHNFFFYLRLANNSTNLAIKQKSNEKNIWIKPMYSIQSKSFLSRLSLNKFTHLNLARHCLKTNLRFRNEKKKIRIERYENFKCGTQFSNLNSIHLVSIL